MKFYSVTRKIFGLVVTLFNIASLFAASLKVVSTAPLNGANNAAVDVFPVITFDQPVDSKSLNGSVNGVSFTPFQLVFNPEQTVLKIDLGQLSYGQLVEIRVDGTLKNHQGELMQDDFLFHFHCEKNVFSKRPSTTLILPSQPIVTGKTVNVSGQAQGYVWKREENNPLQLIHWKHDGTIADNSDVLHPSALYFPEPKDGYHFWLYYTPYPPGKDENPVLMRSNDGINFDYEGVQNPLFVFNTQPSFDIQNLADPEVYLVGETWMMFYEMETPKQEATNIGAWMKGGGYIGLAFSNDGKNWMPYGGPYDSPLTTFPPNGNPIIWPDNTKQYETALDAKTGEPAVIFKDGIFHMWRTVFSSSEYQWHVVYSTAYDPQGEWTKHDWLLRWKSGDLGPHSDVVYDAKRDIYLLVVVKPEGQDKGQLYFYYSGHPEGPWKPHPANPVFCTLPSNSWEDNYLYRSSLVDVNDQWYLYYTGDVLKGSNGENTPQIGLAYEVQGIRRIEISFDKGQNWHTVSANSDRSWQYEWTPQQGGWHTVYVRVIDDFMESDPIMKNVYVCNLVNNWTQTPASGFQDSAVTPSGTIWACGNDGTIWYSLNKGKSWVQTSASGFKRITANDDYVVACGFDGTIWWSTDLGKSWVKTNASGFGDVAISHGDSPYLFASGNEDTPGSIWQSSVQGGFSKWLNLNVPGYQSVACNNQYVVGVKRSGTIFYKEITGSDWNVTSASGMGRASINSDHIIFGTGQVDGSSWFVPLSNSNGGWTQDDAKPTVGFVSCDANSDLKVAVDKNGNIWTKISYSQASYSNSNVGFVLDECLRMQLNSQSINYWDAYIEQMLNLLGLKGKSLPLSDMEDSHSMANLDILIIGDQSGSFLSEKARSTVRQWVSDGGILIGFALQDFDDIFGIKTLARQKEADIYSVSGYFDLLPNQITTDIHPQEFANQKLLIFSDISLVDAQEGSEELARLFDSSQNTLGHPAITWASYGNGYGGYFAFDVAKTIWILNMGKPANDPLASILTADMQVQDTNSRRVPYADEIVFLLQNMIAERHIPFIYQIPPNNGDVPDALFYFGGDEYKASDNRSKEASDWMKGKGLGYHINIQHNHPGTKAYFYSIRDNGHEIGLYFNNESSSKNEDYQFEYSIYKDFARKFKEKMGYVPTTTVNFRLHWKGSWGETACWMSQIGCKSDNSFHCNHASGVNDPYFGFGFGTSYPYYFYFDYSGNNRRIDYLEQPIICYEVGHYSSIEDTIVDADGLASTSHEEEIHLPIRMAVKYHMVMNMFYHPVYISNVGGKYPGCQKALEELLKYIQQIGANVLYFGNDAVWKWWNDRRNSYIKNVSISTDALSFDAVCKYKDGMIAKIPIWADHDIKAEVNGKLETHIFKHEFGRRWAFISLPYGDSHIAISQ